MRDPLYRYVLFVTSKWASGMSFSESAVLWTKRRGLGQHCRARILPCLGLTFDTFGAFFRAAQLEAQMFGEGSNKHTKNS